MLEFWMFIFILGFFLYIISCVLVFIYKKLEMINPTYVEIYLLLLVVPLIFFVIVLKAPTEPREPSFEECRMNALVYCADCERVGNYESCEVKFRDSKWAKMCCNSLSGRDLKNNSFVINCTRLVGK